MPCLCMMMCSTLHEQRENSNTNLPGAMKLLHLVTHPDHEGAGARAGAGAGAGAGADNDDDDDGRACILLAALLLLVSDRGMLFTPMHISTTVLKFRMPSSGRAAFSMRLILFTLYCSM